MKEAHIKEARRLREKHGWTFERLGKKFGLHPTTIYYALNPKRRSRWVSSGAQRSVYLTDDVWEALAVLAAAGRKSRSAMLADLVLERSEVLRLTPALFEGEQ